MNKENIIVFDIETSPNVVYSWSVGYNINLTPNQIVEERKIICICWKKLGQKKVHSLTWDSKSHCDKAMLSKFLKVLEDCDLAIAHNGDSFDIKWLRTRALYHGLSPAGCVRTADTLKLSRSSFNFNSNKLDYIGQYLGVGSKLAHTGFSLWVDVMNGNKTALKHMVSYCKQDVLLLEKVLLKMLPHVAALNFSRAMLSGGDRLDCPSCASAQVQKYGTYAAKSLKYQKYKCSDCGHVYRDTRSLPKRSR